MFLKKLPNMWKMFIELLLCLFWVFQYDAQENFDPIAETVTDTKDEMNQK